MKFRRQFSIRGLLLLTAGVSLVLAFAVKLPVVFQLLLTVAAIVLVVVAVFSSANFATSERRPRLAMVAWLLLAVFFGAFDSMCIAASVRLLDESLVVVPIVLCLVMTLCCLVCLYQAANSFRKASGQRAAKNDGSTTPPS